MVPVKIKDVDGGLGNIFLFSGDITEDEIIKANIQHFSQDTEKFQQYRYSLADLTAVTRIDVSTDGIIEIANLSKKAATKNPNAVVALIADQDYTFGLSRMLEVYRDETGWDEMVFRDRKEAEAWIKKIIKEKYAIEDLTFK